MLALVLGAGCRPDREPKGPDARHSTLADVSVRGHDTRVDLAEGPSLRGELVAVGPEGLWLWTGESAIAGATGGPKRVPRRWRDGEVEHRFVPVDQIRRVVVSRYRAGAAMGAAGGWTGGLVLLTLTHGWYFFISMPLTVVLGGGAVLATHLQSKAYVHRRGLGNHGVALSERLPALRGFSRFPQGVPPGWPTMGEGEPASGEAESPIEPEVAPPTEPGEPEPVEPEPGEPEPGPGEPEQAAPVDVPPVEPSVEPPGAEQPAPAEPDDGSDPRIPEPPAP